MSEQFPLNYTLEDGVEVTVRRTGENTYDFTLNKEGNESHFTYVDDSRSRDEKTAHLNFDQLNAVRAFWLKEHDVV